MNLFTRMFKFTMTKPKSKAKAEGGKSKRETKSYVDAGHQRNALMTDSDDDKPVKRPKAVRTVVKSKRKTKPVPTDSDEDGQPLTKTTPKSKAKAEGGKSKMETKSYVDAGDTDEEDVPLPKQVLMKKDQKDKKESSKGNKMVGFRFVLHICLYVGGVSPCVYV